jgi:DDE superfamily endonuclease
VNLNTMRQIRHQLWQCFSRSADALFELADALTGEGAACSLPELSKASSFRRKWSSVYEALEDGRIDTQRWSRIWTQALLASHEGPVWMSVDSTSIARPEAETSPDRGMIYVCNLPHESRPVSVGWQFSTIMLLPEKRSSWGAILSQRRIQSQQTAISVAIEQVEQLRPLLPAHVRILADRWYATGAFLLACQRMQVEVLLHILRNRKLYRPAPGPTKGKRGAPRKDGTLFQGSHPETWGEPEQEWRGTDEAGKPIVVQVWHRLHFRQAREVEVSVYRVLRERARGTKRDPRESWFCWMGKAPLPLEEVAVTYRHRFSHEHTYRFLKQDLFWTKVRVRTPQQFERWSLVVATAMNYLVLARHLGQACYRPWERRREVVTPRPVRRVMPAILAQLGTPAKEPKPRGKSPGWCRGTPRTPAPRFAVMKKPKPVPKTQRKRA